VGMEMAMAMAVVEMQGIMGDERWVLYQTGVG